MVVAIAHDVNCIMLNVTFPLVLVDAYMYGYAAERKIKNKFEKSVCEKKIKKKSKGKNKSGAQKGAKLKFCTLQNLYISE